LRISRQASAASALTSVGLPGWIATSEEDYVRRAGRFVRGLENAYRWMWRRWCEGGEPQG
jgi:predicted O-linked N-acetylglucosamine transferase (SPINDLY family)